MANTSAKICPIWNVDAKRHRMDQGSDYLIIVCPRSGGKYRISETARSTVQSLDQESRARLTTWIVDQHLLGNEIPQIDSTTVSRAKNARRLTVMEKRERLMRYLARKVRHLGDWVELGGHTTDEKETNMAEMLAWTESIEGSEIYYLLKHNANAGHVERQSSRGHGARLTPDGYTYLAELDATNFESTQAFVAMWFNTSMEDAYENGFDRAIADSGFKPVRVDRVEHINKIDDEIIAGIRRSLFVVADFTGHRGGVYFEAGFAMGLGRQVVWTVRKDDVANLHLDIRQYNFITWDDPVDLAKKLQVRIEAIVGVGPLSGHGR